MTQESTFEELVGSRFCTGATVRAFRLVRLRLLTESFEAFLTKVVSTLFGLHWIDQQVVTYRANDIASVAVRNDEFSRDSLAVF